jgi:hypothetical protein
MRTKILVAASMLLVIAGSLMVVWACGPASSSGPELELEVVGAGTVTVTKADGGAFCTAREATPCRQVTDRGQALKLVAKPDAGNGFLGWTGAAPATELEVQVTVDAHTYVRATFRPLHTLTVAISGTGRVVGSGAAGAIDCQSGSEVGCSRPVPEGEAVALEASTPAAGWTFLSWTTPGGTVLTNPLLLATVTTDTTITATFTPVSAADLAGTYTFTLPTPFNNCISGQLLMMRPYLVVTLTSGTPSFTFYPLSEVPPLAPVTLQATTWDPATRHAAGMSGFSTTCPSLGAPPCQFCFAFQVDLTFSATTPVALTGTLTVHGMPDLSCGSTCLQRYDGFTATRVP